MRGAWRISGRPEHQTLGSSAPAHNLGTARALGASKGRTSRKGGDQSRAVPPLACGIGARSFNIKRRKCRTTFRRVRPTLRWRTVFLRNENRRLRGAKANWRQPQERKTRIGALEARLAAWGAAIFPNSEEFPLPGEGRQMRSRTGPKMAQRHHPTTSV
ncbi:hypothetical protein TcG_07556 [Trypanosoma cruzi]|nr:hypothetical protein TcG_07556 [Trypanosoma cruzi]